MLPIQPPLIPAFFCFDKKQPSASTAEFYKSFFLSWEDALWHLLKVYSIQNNSKVLVPELFCGDVVDNMRAHGLQRLTYAIDKYLQPNQADFIKKLQIEKPEIVVVFHAVGITNPLLKNSKKWLSYLPQNSLLIEDCVHRVINPQTLKFIAKNHYIIDSLRKVVPVQGSRVYSQQPVPKTTITTDARTAWYRLQVFFWWAVMQLFLVFVYYSKSQEIQKIGNKLAEFAMKKGYDVIGDNKQSSCGIVGMHWLSEKIDEQKIYENKIKQFQLYQRLLQPISISKHFFEIPLSKTDYSQLRGFPLGIELKKSDHFLKYVRSQNLLLRFELNDSEWSNKQKIVYLPMGLHVTNTDIEWICKVITSYTI